jgi:hypothetical protein
MVAATHGEGFRGPEDRDRMRAIGMRYFTA